MKEVLLNVRWTCDECGEKKVIFLDHEPDEYKNEYPFEIPEGWILDTNDQSHYCSDECVSWKYKK